MTLIILSEEVRSPAHSNTTSKAYCSQGCCKIIIELQDQFVESYSTFPKEAKMVTIIIIDVFNVR